MTTKSKSSSGKWNGTRVERLRLRYRMTQLAFAEKLGVSYASVNRWENDQAKPSPLAIQRMEVLEESNGKEG